MLGPELDRVAERQASASGRRPTPPSAASIASPSASVTPTTRPSRDRISATSAPVRTFDAERRRAGFERGRERAASSARDRALTGRSPVVAGGIHQEHGGRTRGPRALSTCTARRAWRAVRGSPRPRRPRPTRSATAIGSARIASRPVFAPRSRNAFPSFRPAIASAIEGDFASGGVIALMYARKLATARTFWSNAGYAAASCACRDFEPLGGPRGVGPERHGASRRAAARTPARPASMQLQPERAPA